MIVPRARWSISITVWLLDLYPTTTNKSIIESLGARLGDRLGLIRRLLDKLLVEFLYVVLVNGLAAEAAQVLYWLIWLLHGLWLLFELPHLLLLIVCQDWGILDLCCSRNVARCVLIAAEEHLRTLIWVLGVASPAKLSLLIRNFGSLLGYPIVVAIIGSNSVLVWLVACLIGETFERVRGHQRLHPLVLRSEYRGLFHSRSSGSSRFLLGTSLLNELLRRWVLKAFLAVVSLPAMVSSCVVRLFDLGLGFVVLRLLLLGLRRSRRCLSIALLFLAPITDQAHIPLELFPL